MSAFKLAELFRQGGPAAIDPFLATYEALGYTVLRVWDYVTWSLAANGLEGWDSPGPSTWLAFLAYVRSRGWYVALTVYTGDEPDRVEAGVSLVADLCVVAPDNLLVEGANENGVNNKRISESAQRRIAALCAQASVPFCGWTFDGRHVGTYLTAHTPRDSEWPRRAHDLLEYYDGGGPASPADPPHHVPCVADEPIRADQAGFSEVDLYAYAAACALLGAGATFHSQSGKVCDLPSPPERACAAAFARGLLVFPPDAPLLPYDRPAWAQPGSLRSYTAGGRYLVRIRPTSAAPIPGWTPLDDLGVCWAR